MPDEKKSSAGSQSIRTIEYQVHVDETIAPSSYEYYIIMGHDLISDLKLVLYFDTKSISWDNIDQPAYEITKGVV
jgi:hypothetical protein